MSVGFASMALACAWLRGCPTPLMSPGRAAPDLLLYFAALGTRAAKPAPLWKLGGGGGGRPWRANFGGAGGWGARRSEVKEEARAQRVTGDMSAVVYPTRLSRPKALNPSNTAKVITP